jgi:putative Ca2+/H+ antiporter (TMEM165/GDT1 family)
MDWKLFGLSFGMLFLAELGDKTQLAVFTLVTQNNKPIPVFLGASLALILVTLIGAFFGQLVTRYIPAKYLQLAAGLLFVIIGAFVLKDVIPEFLSRGARLQ